MWPLHGCYFASLASVGRGASKLHAAVTLCFMTGTGQVLKRRALFDRASLNVVLAGLSYAAKSATLALSARVSHVGTTICTQLYLCNTHAGHSCLSMSSYHECISLRPCSVDVATRTSIRSSSSVSHAVTVKCALGCCTQLQRSLCSYSHCRFFSCRSAR